VFYNHAHKKDAGGMQVPARLPPGYPLPCTEQLPAGRRSTAEGSGIAPYLPKGKEQHFVRRERFHSVTTLG